jgi:hypothetical protein
MRSATWLVSMCQCADQSSWVIQPRNALRGFRESWLWWFGPNNLGVGLSAERHELGGDGVGVLIPSGEGNQGVVVDYICQQAPPGRR